MPRNLVLIEISFFLQDELGISDAEAARIQSEFKGDSSLNDLTVENLAKPLLDEFLNTCDYKVSVGAVTKMYFCWLPG